MNLEQISKIVSEWASSEPRIIKTYIYGSRVRGDERKDSDLDIAIQLKSLENGEDDFTNYFFEEDNYTRRLQALLPIKVHLQYYDGGEWTEHVQKGIAQSSILVYDSSK